MLHNNSVHLTSAVIAAVACSSVYSMNLVHAVIAAIRQIWASYNQLHCTYGYLWCIWLQLVAFHREQHSCGHGVCTDKVLRGIRHVVVTVVPCLFCSMMLRWRPFTGSRGPHTAVWWLAVGTRLSRFMFSSVSCFI